MHVARGTGLWACCSRHMAFKAPLVSVQRSLHAPYKPASPAAAGQSFWRAYAAASQTVKQVSLAQLKSEVCLWPRYIYTHQNLEMLQWMLHEKALISVTCVLKLLTFPVRYSSRQIVLYGDQRGDFVAPGRLISGALCFGSCRQMQSVKM